MMQKEVEFLFLYPKLNSVVAASILKAQRLHSALSDREAKELNALGRKFYSTGAVGIKHESYITCMSW